MSGRRIATERRIGSALGTLLAWITSLLLLGLVLEGGLRLLPLPLARPVVGINEPDPDLGWVKRPNESNTRETSEFEVTFTINELGLRDDPDMTRAKPSGERRVLMVGDSFVLGYAVERDDLFVDLLERALTLEGSPVDVVNAGTEGYSTDQELVWLRREGLGFDPDVVVVCFYQNDVWWNGRTSYTGFPKPRFPAAGNAVEPEPRQGEARPRAHWLARWTAAFGFLARLGTAREYAAELSYSSDGVRMEKDATVTLTDPPAALAPELEDCWQRTAACLRGLRDTCAEAGKPLLLLPIPSREQVEPEAAAAYRARTGLEAAQFDPQLPTERLLAIAAVEGIATLDVRPALREAAADGTRLYFEEDWHVNPAGNRVLATELYRRLVDEDYLGGGARPEAEAALAPASPDERMLRWPFVVIAIWLALSSLYSLSYRDERPLAAAARVGALIAVVAAIVLAFDWLVEILPGPWGAVAGLVLVVAVLGWIVVSARTKIGTITEVYASFVRQGHWYMIPLLVVMLAIGGLLVVASSSPFIAPFIYTLF